MTWMEMIINALFGGGLFGLLSWWQTKESKEKDHEFDMMDRLSNEITRIDKQNVELRAEIKALNIVIDELKSENKAKDDEIERLEFERNRLAQKLAESEEAKKAKELELNKLKGVKL